MKNIVYIINGQSTGAISDVPVSKLKKLGSGSSGGSVVVPDTNTTYSAGAGLSLTGTTFNNTAPNIVQTLNLSGATLTLSNGGGSVTLPTGTTYTAGSGITITGSTIANSSPNIVQTVSISGNTITLSNGGGSVVVPDTNTTYSAGTNLSLVGTTFNVSNSPTFSGNVTASAFYESSLRKYKENIKTFEKSGLDLVDSLEIVTFDKIDGPKDKIGVILDDSPKEFASESGEEIDLYKTIFIQAKAIQELRAEIQALKEKIK